MASRAADGQWIEVDWERDEGLGDLPLGEAAAFVLEPGSSGGRVGFPPRALVEALARRVSEAGGLVEELERSRLVEKAREDGAYLLAGLEAIRARHPLIREVRGRGLMLAIELEPSAGPSRALRVAEGLFERGIILVRRPGLEILRLDPALTVPREDLDELLATLDTVVGALE